MAKAFGLVMMMIALYIGMTVYSKGFDQAYSSAFAPIQPTSQRDTPIATELTGAAGLADAPSGGENRPIKVTDAVRNQVSGDMALGAERRGYGAESD
jgi:hypothetical protein